MTHFANYSKLLSSLDKVVENRATLPLAILLHATLILSLLYSLLEWGQTTKITALIFVVLFAWGFMPALKFKIRQRLIPIYIDWAVFAFCSLVIISAVLSLRPFIELLYFLFLVILPYLMARLCDPCDIPRLIKYIAFFIGLAVVLSFLFISRQLNWWTDNRLTIALMGTRSIRVLVGMTMGVGTVMIAAILLSPTNLVRAGAGKLTFLWITFGVMGSLAVMIAARTALIGELMCSVLLAATASWCSLRRRLAVPLYFLVIVLLTIGINGRDHSPNARVSDTDTNATSLDAVARVLDTSMGGVPGGAENSLMIRITIYKFALRQFLDSPLIGQGARNVDYLYSGNKHAHNIFLQILAELGFVGLIIFFAIIIPAIFMLLRIVRSKSSKLRSESWLVFAMLVYYLIYEQAFGNYFYALHIFLMCGLAVAVIASDSTESTPESVRYLGFSLKIVGRDKISTP